MHAGFFIMYVAWGQKSFPRDVSWPSSLSLISLGYVKLWEMTIHTFSSDIHHSESSSQILLRVAFQGTVDLAGGFLCSHSSQDTLDQELRLRRPRLCLHGDHYPSTTYQFLFELVSFQKTNSCEKQSQETKTIVQIKSLCLDIGFIH